MNQPLVTIVTPSYNHERFIRQTIESVLSQDYPAIEYIVMDGASRDQTASVVAPYADRLTFISEPDRGQSHAINKGFAMAKGEIVAWLNSDDLLLPGAVSKAVAAFSEKPQAAVVYGEGYQIDIDGNITAQFPHTQPFDLWRLTHLSDYILQQSVFFRKAALEAVGGIREDLHYVMDWDILIRLGKEYDFVYSPEHFGSLREYEAAKTFSGGGKRAAEIRKMLQGHTGMPVPEGYVVYGLDAYSQAWLSAIAAWPEFMGPLKRGTADLVRKVCHRIIGHVATHAQGVYTDGWMSKRARLMLRRGSGKVSLRGHRPDVPQLAGQRVSITCGKELCTEQPVDAGDFEICFEAPSSSVLTAPTFELRFSRAFVPAEISASADTRALSAFLHGISWVP